MSVLFLSETTSTNDYLLSHGCTEPFFCVAAYRQTGGKGSKGRSFVSPYGGLYLSVLVYPDRDVLPVLTPLAAVAVRRAVKNVFSLDLSVKWVNDLFSSDGKKVCGILTECHTAETIKAVVGVGINVFRAPSGYGEYEKVVGYLSENNPDEKVLQKLADEIVAEFRYLIENKDEGMEEYARASFLTGKKVKYRAGDAVLSGVVSGVDENGRLLLDVDGKRIRCENGEVIKW